MNPFKNIVHLAILSLLTITSFSQGVAIPEPAADEAIVVFIRPAAMTAVLDNFIIKNGDQEWCRISNNRYFYVAVSSSELALTAQRGNTGGLNSFQLQITKASINYVLCEVIAKDGQPQLNMKIISKQTANQYLSKAKPDQCMIKVEMPEKE